MSDKPTYAQEILDLINSSTWNTRFEILPGLFTPGLLPVNAKALFNKHKIPEDLQGLKALDIGTFDGAVAFELERRGADVYAMDIQDPDQTGFNTAKTILNSAVQYQRNTVYNLLEMYGSEFFDFVVFKGVYYHLKHPLRAIEAVRDVLKLNGMALIAGEILLSYAVDEDGKQVSQEIVTSWAESKVPLSVIYPGVTPGRSGTTTWFVPNLACLRSWFNATGLEIMDHHIFHNANSTPPQQRFTGKLKRTGDSIIEHPIMVKGWPKARQAEVKPRGDST